MDVGVEGRCERITLERGKPAHYPGMCDRIVRLQQVPFKVHGHEIRSVAEWCRFLQNIQLHKTTQTDVLICFPLPQQNAGDRVHLYEGMKFILELVVWKAGKSQELDAAIGLASGEAFVLHHYRGKAKGLTVQQSTLTVTNPDPQELAPSYKKGVYPS